MRNELANPREDEIKTFPERFQGFFFSPFHHNLFKGMVRVPEDSFREMMGLLESAARAERDGGEKRPKVESLEQAVERAAETLPDGWSIELSVEKDAGTVQAIRPDGSTVDIYEDESCITDLFFAALKLAHDEERSNAMVQIDVKGEAQQPASGR